MKSIRFRLLMYLLLISVISLLVLGLFSYMLSVKTLKKNTNNVMSNTVKQIGNNVENRIEKLDKYTYLIFTNERIQKLLAEKKLDDSTELYAVYKELNSIFSYYFYGERYFVSANIFSMNGGEYVYRNEASNNVDLYKKTNGLENAMIMDGSVQWEGSKRISDSNGRDLSLFAVSRVLKDLRNKKPLLSIGKLYVTFSEEIFSDSYANFHTDKSSEIFIVDDNGRIVSHTDKSLIDKDLSGESYIGQALKNDEGVLEQDYNNQKSLISYYHIKNKNWWVIESVPYTYVTGQIKYIVFLTAIVCLACLIGICTVSLFLSKRFVKPLLQLNKAMKEVENGNFETALQVTTQDEISQIKNHFNKMVKRIKELFERTIEQEREKKKEELRALQYQVNPHFLYNTLNTIRLMAMLSKANNVTMMTEALIRLLRNTIGKQGDRVAVAVELENIKDYIHIQQVRYNDSIEVEYLVDERMMDCLMPNFILQPLIENSIFHGLEPKSGKGHLVIRGILEPDHITFSLEDNGVGMSEEDIQQLFTKKEHTNSYVSIGVKNVNDRIRISYGAGYGVEVQSVMGEGTQVKVRLPLFREEERGGE
ncbi:cache domain-containing sensor histidine kinase [Paenibacillus eucommiae]|uniref:Two-component system sensor histidine kinase YesM n=1 Tax=Paenibacillus eucommiae TaxID=1355755 RepID=A0ABS4IRC5_9BACL|nr:sensor histidine kinase [Paenibacillus eucommiae]MBP1990124.1 two-component system sensor histidine kinase YesM [Paenibacillus eucommiae]